MRDVLYWQCPACNATVIAKVVSFSFLGEFDVGPSSLDWCTIDQLERCERLVEQHEAKHIPVAA